MAFCISCGRHYIIGSGRMVTRAVVAQGQAVQTEIPNGKCPDCRRPGEEENLVLIGQDDLYGVHGS